MFIRVGTIFLDEKNLKYEVIEPIDNGSFGYVYKLKRLRDKTFYALKTLSSVYVDESSLKAFENESRLAVQINNDNVIKYEFVHNGNIFKDLPPYIIMEYANEGTLKALINRRQKNNEYFSVDELNLICNSIINGVESVNTKLIHRDLKPDNILIKDGVIKISDFGLSKLVEDSTRTFTFKGIGHIMYMAPEGWNYDKNTIAMDIYSAGIIFYELCTLKHPLIIKNLGNIEEWKDAHFFQIPEPPININKNIPINYSQTIMRMLEKDNSKRISNWKEIRESIGNERSIRVLNPSIQNMVKKRLERDYKISEEQMEKDKRAKEVKDFEKLVYYQFEEELIKPLDSFVNDFNSAYELGKISLTYSNVPSYRLSSEIRLVSNIYIKIEIRTLIDENFYRITRIKDFGRIIEKKELKRPHLQTNKILAWGKVEVSNNVGFNLFLVEKNENVYGEWIIMKNRTSALARDQGRPNPFAFSFDEIEKELQYIGAMHIYVPEIKNFDINEIFRLIEEFN